MEKITATNIRNLIAKIAVKSVELNQSADDKVHVFFDYSGHVDTFMLRLYLGGWKAMIDPDFAYYTGDVHSMYKDAVPLNTLDEVIYVLSYLQTILKYKPQKFDNSNKLKKSLIDGLEKYRKRVQDNAVDILVPLPWDDTYIERAIACAIYDAGGNATDAYVNSIKLVTWECENTESSELNCSKSVESHNPCVDCLKADTCLLAEHDFNCPEEE